MNYRETMSRLNAALNHIDSAYAVIAKKHGITFNALMIICMLEESENVTQKRICDELHLPKSTVHSILQDFIKQDFFTLEPGKNKKEKIVVVTPTGDEHFSKMIDETQRFEDKLLAALGDDACAFLVETAESLGKIIINEVAEISGSEELI